MVTWRVEKRAAPNNIKRRIGTCCASKKGYWHTSRRKQDQKDPGRSWKGEWIKKRNALQAEDSKRTALATKQSLRMHDHRQKTESDTHRAARESAKSNNDVQVMTLQDETEMQTLGGIEPCRKRRGWGHLSYGKGNASLLLLAFPESKWKHVHVERPGTDSVLNPHAQTSTSTNCKTVCLRASSNVDPLTRNKNDKVPKALGTPRISFPKLQILCGFDPRHVSS